MHADMFSYFHCVVHSKLEGNFTLTYVCETKNHVSLHQLTQLNVIEQCQSTQY